MLIVSLIASFVQTRVPVTYKFSKTEELSKVVTFTSGVPREFIVDIFNGSIAVTGYDSDDVQIIIHKIVHAKSEQALAEAERMVSLEIGKKEKGDVLVYLHVPWRTREGGMGDQNLLRYDYDVTCHVEVKVPHHVNLKLKMLDKGNITVSDVDGTFDLQHINGSITMEHLSGSGHARTINGSVRAIFRTTPSQPSSFETTNGDVEVHLRKDLSADLILKTLNGEVTTDFEGVILPHQIRTGKRNQKNTYQVNDAETIKVGNGGPSITCTTLNGNIRVLKNDD